MNAVGTAKHSGAALFVAALLTAIVAALLWHTAPAAAGTYEVRQCDYTLGIGHHEFQHQRAGDPDIGAYYQGSACNEFGLAVRNGAGGTARHYPNGGYGGWFAYAPSGTAISGFCAALGGLTSTHTSSEGITGATTYAAAFTSGQAQRSYFQQGYMPVGSWNSPHGRCWSAGQAGWNAQSVGFYIRCGQPDYAAFTQACYQSQYGDLRFRGRSFAFTMTDVVNPSVNVGGSLLTGGWVRGTRTLDFAASDGGSGLTGVNAILDDGTNLPSGSSCASQGGYWISLRPCPLDRAGTFNIDTTTLPDGGRTVTVRTADVGGATAQQTRAVNVDNTAPAVPIDPSVDGGEDWRQSNAFTQRWTTPAGQHAPITKAHYEICPILPAGSCVLSSRDGTGIQSMNLAMPGRGVFRVRTWLEDGAGNVNAASKSAPLIMRYDDQAPGAASPEQSNGWMNAQEAASYDQRVDLGQGQTRPVSDIAGYSVTTNGSDPDGTIDVAGDPGTLRINDLAEGVTTIKARAISGARVPSAQIGTNIVKVDKSAPSVTAAGVPDAAVWSREAVTVRLVASDQAHLSGMTAAPDSAAPEQGGHIVYRVDGGSPKVVRGDAVTIPVTDDGKHTVTYHAVDVAGNRSAEFTKSFKLDTRGPGGAWEPQEPSDPRQLAVTVFDDASGVKDGQIQYRAVGDREFKNIKTDSSPNRLVAQLADVDLPNGRYEFRATAVDHAGNGSGDIERMSNGQFKVLTLPVRLPTATRVAGGTATKLSPCARKAEKKRTAKKRRQAMKKCKTKKIVVPAGRSSFAVKFGKRASTVGQVTTSEGVPVAGAYVTVETQLRVPNAPFVRIGAAKADGQGVFRFAIPKGASRIVRYRFEGTPTIRPSDGQVQTRVLGSLNFRVNKRTVRNRQSVVFRGRVRGGPIPDGGKLVVLRAKVPGVARWRTFGNTRTDSRGYFKYKRKFESTYGRVHYSFRAVATPERTYSYGRGLSKVVRVLVTGN